MKIEIIWYPGQDLEVAAQKGESYNTTVVVDGMKHTISFIEYGSLRRSIEIYEKKDIPFDLSSWENGLAIREITVACINEAVEYLVLHKRMDEFPYLL